MHFSICIPLSLAEDRVTVRTDSGAGKVILVGRVADWTGHELRIRTGDDVRAVDAEQIIDVQTTRLQSHLDGLTALEAGQPDDAARHLAAALEQEPRLWMRRDILAALVRTELARGGRAKAAAHFLALVSSDPATRHFHVIPLDWSTDSPEPALAGQARSWLADEAIDAARLIGASILLFDKASADAATKALDELASDTDPRIYPLARAQLWRRQLARSGVSSGEIERWADRVTEVPEPLRGGAYYVVGRAWAGTGSPERAAAALLWLPLVYDADAPLAAEAAVLAGDELSKIGRSADAAVLYHEVTKRFAYTPAAKVARERLSYATSNGGEGKVPAEPPSSQDAGDSDRSS